MKRIFALLLTLCLLPGLALAESSLLFSAVVQPAETHVLKAPASGTLTPFTAREGDVAHENELLFEIEPTNVYADVAGTVALVNADAGDSADAAVSRFGSVLLVEYDERYEIHTSTRTGYNNAENRNVYVGTPVYLRSLNGEHHADGRVTSVSGTEITVQVIGGDLVFTHEVRIYREPDYAADTMIARGSLSTVAPRAYSASGTITEMFVQPGDRVEAGDLLFSHVPDVLDPERRGRADALKVFAEEEMILSAVNVQAASGVSKGQALASYLLPGDYELCGTVRECDLPLLSVGDVLTVQFDEISLPETTATVASISPLGADNGEESMYTVYLTLSSAEGVLPGMHVTVEK